jgi:hypothetical protein
MTTSWILYCQSSPLACRRRVNSVLEEQQAFDQGMVLAAYHKCFAGLGQSHSGPMCNCTAFAARGVEL